MWSARFSMNCRFGSNSSDERKAGCAIDVKFTGTLREDQERAFEALRDHDTGVLAATTAFGKTVVGARMIAERGVGTLVLVHRRQLMDQWVERLSTFLDLPRAKIGSIGGGKRRPTGVVDVALIQSLVRKGEVDDIVGDYGQLIVDECHHLSAVSFELVARRTKARFVLGLSATVTRKDGHHPIIFMQCGPIRFRVRREERGRQEAVPPSCSDQGDLVSTSRTSGRQFAADPANLFNFGERTKLATL